MSDRIDHALRALRQLHSRGGRWPAQVKVRAPFFVGGPYAPSPIARLSAPRGVNLQIYLLALFEAQSRRRNGIAGPCPVPISGAEISWVDLVVSEAKQNMQARPPVTATQNRIRQIKSAIKRLADENLVLRNVGDPSDHFPLMLLQEPELGLGQAEERDYVIPEYYEGGKSAVALPVQFFTNGWVYVLTDSEIRMYLILKHLAARFRETHLLRGVYLTERDRDWLYGISRDVYEAHLMLSRFGLIELAPNPLRHQDGRVVDFENFLKKGGVIPPHRFRIAGDSPFFESPLGKVRRALLNYPPSREQMRRRDEIADQAIGDV
ncbi:hypothetical protein [Streptomyces sp. KS_5]|uniref:hypothetical protein n=1 Tax=Streptomyces sp. KS_5 TaxID=1881018 RepID=UPI00115FFEB4|nr:hypothetical protein [Streptomyces sp. KS_5]